VDLTNDVKRRLIEAELIQTSQEEYVLKTRLAVALEVKNDALVERTQPQVEMLRRTIDALKKKLDEIADMP